MTLTLKKSYSNLLDITNKSSNNIRRHWELKQESIKYILKTWLPVMPPKLAAKCNLVSNQSLRVTKIMVIMRRTKKPKRTFRSIICNFEVIEEDYKWLFLGWGQGLKWAWASRSSTPAPYIISYYAAKGPRPQRDPEGALTQKGPRRGRFRVDPIPKGSSQGPQRGPFEGLRLRAGSHSWGGFQTSDPMQSLPWPAEFYILV